MSNSNSYMREYMRNRYRRRRAKVIEFLGGQCAACGSKNKLEIDHKDRNQKSMTLGRACNCSEERLWEEISKCQLLCKSCHSDKSINDLGFKKARGNHGTISTYKYCRCSLCREAKSTHSRNYKQRLRLAIVTR